MQRPIFESQQNTREMISAFLGYNHRLVQNPGEFYKTENITTAQYPMLAPRTPIRTFQIPDLPHVEPNPYVFSDAGVVVRAQNGDEPDIYSIKGDDGKYSVGYRLQIDCSVRYKTEVSVWTEVTDLVCGTNCLPDSHCILEGHEFRQDSSLINKKTYICRQAENKSAVSTMEVYFTFIDDILVFADQEACDLYIKANMDALFAKQSQIMEQVQAEDWIRWDTFISVKQYIPQANTTALIKNGKICYISNSYFVYDGQMYDLADAIKVIEDTSVFNKLQMLSFGTKILLFPIGLFFDTEKPEEGLQALHAIVEPTVGRNFYCYPCRFDGFVYNKVYYGASGITGIGVGDYVVQNPNGFLYVYQMQADGELQAVAIRDNTFTPSPPEHRIYIQNSQPSAIEGDFWLDTTGCTGKGLAYYATGTMYVCRGGIWETVTNVLYTNADVYTYWLDTTDAENPVFKAYSSASDSWMAVANAYVLVSNLDSSSLNEGDTVQFSNMDTDKSCLLHRWSNIYRKTENGIVIKNMLKSRAWQAPNTWLDCPNKLEKIIPDMDYVTVSQNRVWGCKFGYDADGKHLNQIYASKLGDPSNWYCYENVSTDSYALSLGDDEPFTGAVSYNEMPYFFKENKIYGIYGGYPASYQLHTIEDRGVEAGSAASAVVVNGYLFYKSASDICAFDGSTVTGISAALGNTVYSHAAAGGALGKYYISMQNAQSGKYCTFVYDTNCGLWVKRDENQYLSFLFNHSGAVYALDAHNIFHEIGRQDNQIPADLLLYDTEKAVHWYAETGPIDFAYPDKKYISNIDIRARITLGAVLEISVQYDSNGLWQRKGTLSGTSTPKTYVLGIIPQRCDHYAIRFAGTGDVQIISIANTMKQGGDR